MLRLSKIMLGVGSLLFFLCCRKVSVFILLWVICRWWGKLVFLKVFLVSRILVGLFLVSRILMVFIFVVL